MTTMTLARRDGAQSSRSLERLAANLFFLFFVAQILSPQIGGFALYLEGLIAVCNPYYWRWLTRLRVRKSLPGIMMVLLFAMAALAPMAMARVAFQLNSVLFLIYAYEAGLFYLFRYLAVSVLFAVAQSVLMLVSPDLARSIGPTAISEAIWGDKAVATFTNFYSVLFITRVSGLSRESGFLAALINAAVLLYLVEPRQRTRGRRYALIAGWLLSLSKISLILAVQAGILRLRRLIDRIPPEVTLAGVFGSIALVTNIILPGLLASSAESLLHRLGAYAVIGTLDLRELMFGVDDLGSLRNAAIDALGGKFEDLAGFAGFVLNYGLLLVIVWFAMLRTIGLTSTGLLLIFFGTMNVSPLTNQNFVIVTYFVAMYLLRPNGRRTSA